MFEQRSKPETTFNPGIGFADPVFDSQAAFRHVMSALAEPGTIHDLGPRNETPAGLMAGTATILLTLADYETPTFLADDLQQGDAGAWLRFHCGAPAAGKAEASFAVLDGTHGDWQLQEFSPGTELFPDRACTLIVQVSALEGGTPLEAQGPGIKGARRIHPAGLPANFATQWQANHRLYPLGVDLLLVAGSLVMGLPRSCRLAPANPLS
jgi:alpha-D-ribose 1-methylphosphonate 5-triphosphate synthase subunit PhnH